jgi:hypothetical protein
MDQEDSDMSVKLLVSFGELGYGFAKKISKLEVPASWTSSKKVSDIVKFVCEDYNKSTAPVAAAAASVQLLRADDVYLSSSDGDRVDSEQLCGQLSSGSYIIKMVIII